MKCFTTTEISRSKFCKYLKRSRKNRSILTIRLWRENLHRQLTMCRPKYPAPNFRLTTPKGDSLNLSSYKGKYLYLCFWSSWNAVASNEIKLLTALEEKYGKHIKFLCISIDEYKVDYTKFVKKFGRTKINFAHFNGDMELLGNYDVRSIPLYYLVNQDGSMRISPAPGPDPRTEHENIDKIFHYLVKDLEKKPDVHIGSRNN